MDSQKLEDMLATTEERRINLQSFLAIRNEYIVNKTYFGGNRQDSKHALYSATKSFVSTLIGIALAKGAIEGTDQPILDFFSERQIKNLSAQKEDMTLEDMLTMRSDLDWSDTGDYPAMEKSTDWVQFVLDKPMAEEPGNAWNYCSGCSHVLSAIIQQSTGMNTRDFADEYLFNPLGISDIFWFTDGAGIPDGGSRLQLAPRDMAKLGYLYLREGQWDGQQIVPAEWVKTTTLRHVALDEHFSYGYHWFTVYSLEGFAALGSQGQIILVIPEYDMVVVTTAFTQESILELVEKYVVPAVEK